MIITIFQDARSCNRKYRLEAANLVEPVEIAFASAVGENKFRIPAMNTAADQAQQAEQEDQAEHSDQADQADDDDTAL